MPFAPPEFEAKWHPIVVHDENGYLLRVLAHEDDEPDTGPTLVVVHGLEEVWQVWLPMAQLMHGKYRILILDLPWRAHNDYAWTETLLPSQWLARAIELIGETPDALVGHSFGSNTVLEYLAKPPGAWIRAAVLTSPAYRPDTSGLTWDMFEESRASFGDILAAGLRVRAGSDRKVDPAVFERMVAHIAQRVGPLGFVNLFRLFAHSPFIRTDRVVTPTLVIGGQQDPTATATGIQDLAERLPHGSLETLVDFDHFCEVEQADEIAALTAAHINRNLPRHSPYLLPEGPVPMTLPIGSVAPDFTLRSTDGGTVTLSSFRGEKDVLLVFVPAAFSATCTGEVCDVRDELPAITDENVQVIVVSVDGPYALAAWADEEGLSYPVLSDFWPHGKVARSYGVFYPDAGIALRGTFLIDRTGVVRYAGVVSPMERRERSVWKEAVASAHAGSTAG